MNESLNPPPKPKRFSPFYPVQAQAEAEIPFFWLMTLVFVGVYLLSVFSTPRLQNPFQLSVLTVLMATHTGLHWINTRYFLKGKQIVVYLIIQAALIFLISWDTQNLAMIISLYMAILGEASGMIQQKRWLAVAVVGLLALSGVNFGLAMGWNSMIWWGVSIAPTSVFVMVYVLLYNRQAEARQRAQTLLVELEAANRQLTEYSARVEDLTITNERQRMARELHDTLSQGLAGLILQLEAVDAHLVNNRPERARSIIQQTMERARATLADARRAIDDLRQDQQEPGSLAARLGREVDHFTLSTGIPCELVLDLPEDANTQAEVVLRIVSEGLTNIARHAQAQQAKVSLAVIEKDLAIEIQDDGSGFIPVQVEPGHYGLLGMRERARLAGGVLEINSQPGKGTTIITRIPIQAVVSPQEPGA